MLYTTGAAASADTVEMVRVGEDRYKGAIPGQPLGAIISYFVLAKDVDGNATRSRIFSFKVTEAAGCCGALAITVNVSHPILKPLVEIVANFSLVFVPLVILRLRKRRKVI